MPGSPNCSVAHPQTHSWRCFLSLAARIYGFRLEKSDNVAPSYWYTTCRQVHYVEERNVGTGSAWRYPTKGRGGAIVRQTNIGAVSKAEKGPSSVRPTLELFHRQHWVNIMRDGLERIRAFPSAWTPYWTELFTGGWMISYQLETPVVPQLFHSLERAHPEWVGFKVALVRWVRTDCRHGSLL